MKLTFDGLFEKRKQGMKPADPIILSLVGDLPMEEPVIVLPQGATQDPTVDWRGLFHLEAWIAYADGIPDKRIYDVAEAARWKGEALNVVCWNVEHQEFFYCYLDGRTYIASIIPHIWDNE